MRHVGTFARVRMPALLTYLVTISQLSLIYLSSYPSYSVSFGSIHLHLSSPTTSLLLLSSHLHRSLWRLRRPRRLTAQFRDFSNILLIPMRPTKFVCNVFTVDLASDHPLLQARAEDLECESDGRSKRRCQTGPHPSNQGFLF